MKSRPSPLGLPKFARTPYCFDATPPQAVFWSVGMSWAATSMLKTLPPMAKSRGCMEATEDFGISMRPVLGSSLAPGMAPMYTAKKSSARSTSGDHRIRIRIGSLARLEGGNRELTCGTGVDDPAVDAGMTVLAPYVEDVTLIPQ
jgi:hypothetical protein